MCREKEFNLRETVSQLCKKHMDDGILGLEVAGVDHVQAAGGGVEKFMVFDVSRDKAVTAGCQGQLRQDADAKRILTD